MKQVYAAVFAAAVVAVAATPAPAQTAAPATAGDTAKGKVLVDAKGMTLYTLDRDSAPNKSSCNGQCAINWPPLAVAADAKDIGSWTIVTRDDGSKQWAYKGKPLYFWKDDKKPGDVDGDGRGNGAWHVAAP
jgi:predicted lipoprotein with Yx(FWY)xxD motif